MNQNDKKINIISIKNGRIYNIAVCHMVLAKRRGNPVLKALVCKKLLSAGPCKTLVNLVGTGDRVIQNAIEAQSNWENGPGVELASLVDLAMTVLELLLASTDDKSALGDLNKLVGAETPNPFVLIAYWSLLIGEHHFYFSYVPRRPETVSTSCSLSLNTFTTCSRWASQSLPCASLQPSPGSFQCPFSLA